jgi:acetylornithine deacetylase/succinyl-diaminopimelate desuccinylase-like protein
VADLTGETVELLQALIRNECVNDGTEDSGFEDRNADDVSSYLDGVGLDFEVFSSVPRRSSVVTRIEGWDVMAPTLCLMGHTDVVPVTPSGWSRDPFGGELVDGEVWGRGAIDMLNLTASMAVAVRHLAASGWKPRGTLVYLAVADEEAGGRHGAGWLAEHEYDAIKADYVLTESGGIAMPTPTGTRVTVTVAEKGVAWQRLRVRGTPGHGSMPLATDNALVKAAEVVRRLHAYRPAAQIGDVWRAYAEALDVDDDLRAALVDPARVYAACEALVQTQPGVGRLAHACTHTTFSPNVVHGGVKTNVIPDTVDIDVDVRTLPGEDDESVRGHLAAALGDMVDAVEVVPQQMGMSTASPIDGPLWDAVSRAIARQVPGATPVPRFTSGGTDARFYREKGAVAYGFGLYSAALSAGDFATRFHGNDERVDVESLRLTTQLWIDIATDLLG